MPVTNDKLNKALRVLRQVHDTEHIAARQRQFLEKCIADLGPRDAREYAIQTGQSPDGRRNNKFHKENIINGKV